MKKILLIEDNPEMRENTAEILTLADYEVVTARDGKEGVHHAKEDSPDLIICDVMMPELDGFGVLRMLSKNHDTAGIPFIFLTAKTEKEDFRKGMNLGADDYITKPFDDVELLDAIDMRLQKHERMTRPIEPTAEGIKAFFKQARGMDVLGHLSEEQHAHVYQAKEIIYREGGYPHALLLVNKGKIKAYRTNEDAKEYITGLFKAGDFMGYVPILRDSVYQESAMALEETEVVHIPKEDFFTLMYDHRDVANRFIKLLSDNLAEKEEELLHLAYDSVRRRVADALLHLQKRYHDAKNEEHFKMALTRDNLASLVGTSKECVIRVLSEFKEEKMVSTHKSEITVLDPARLATLPY